MIEFEQGSFRDKDGFIFYHNGAVYRAINPSYKTTWEALQKDTLLNELVQEGKLIGYSPVQDANLLSAMPAAYQVLKVDKVFVSYPSEWSFAQLKKAALLTLYIQKKALAHGYTLKDASAYNIQFQGPRALFIDHLSFDTYNEGTPWQAYGQFCRHFLGPLMVAHYGVDEARSLSLKYIDGLPVPLAAKLLPWRARLNLAAVTHLLLHARFEKKHGASTQTKPLRLPKSRNLTMIEHMEQSVKQLRVRAEDTNWTDYYAACSYTTAGYQAKYDFVKNIFLSIAGKLCVDLGANTGEFSLLASVHFETVVSCDSDAQVIRALHLKKTPNILALQVDLANPTPAFGWNNNERQSFIARIKSADCTLALALLHHLCIGNNLPLSKVASFFAGLGRHLIIEWVPRTDVQVKKLLATRQDIFDEYHLDAFKAAFGAYFEFTAECHLPDSDRQLFHLKNLRTL